VDRDRASKTSRAAFAVVVAGLILATARHNAGVYAQFIERTRLRNGNFWPNGQPVGADFIQFAGVAEAWERGRIDELYASPARQTEFMTLAVESPRHYNPLLQFNYPPFFAWLVRPLTPFDYLQRYLVWTLIQTGFAVVALAFWRRELSPRQFAVVAAGLVVCPPVLSNLVTGQTAFIGLASLSGTMYFLNRGRDFAAGIALSLLFYKPTLGVVLGPLLLAAGRWRVVFGVVSGFLLLVAASLAASVKACADYPHMARELVITAVSYPDFYVRHFNLLGSVSTLLGKTPEEFNWIRRAVVAVPIAVLFVMTAKAWCVRWRPGTPRWSAGAAAAVLTTFVATPYLFAYDTAIAAVAVVYSLRTWNSRPTWHRWFIFGCLSVAWIFLVGDMPLIAAMQERMNVRIQLAPIAMAVWALFEARWAMSKDESEPSNEGNQG